MEHHKELVFVAAALGEVHDVHYAVRLLKQIQRPLVLLALDELVGRVIKLREHDRDFFFTHSELLVVVLVECLGFSIERREGAAALWLG